MLGPGWGKVKDCVGIVVGLGCFFSRKAPISLSFECKLEFQPSAAEGGGQLSYRKVLIFNQPRVFHHFPRAASFRKCWLFNE